MNDQIQASENDRAGSRAERIKQATSNVVASAKETFSHAADRVEEGLHHATDKAAAAADRAGVRAQQYRQRSREAYGDAVDHVDEWLDWVRDHVREKPMQSLAVAVGTGWLISRLLRRR